MTAEKLDAANIDHPPKKVAQEDEEVEPPLPVQEFKFYLKPDVTFKIISTNWGVFTALGGLVYCYHFVFTIAGVNNYTDITRTKACGI